MNYSEAAYFDGAHVAHIAAWYDHRRVRGLLEVATAQARSRQGLRGVVDFRSSYAIWKAAASARGEERLIPSILSRDLADSLGRIVPITSAHR